MTAAHPMVEQRAPAARPARGADPEVPVRGEGLFRALERPFLWAEAQLGRFLPDELNPLLQTGAIANTSLAVAIVSGIVLLLWYVPSVHQAYDSVAAMGERPLTAGFVRSVHRYSSDAAMLFAALHGVRLFVGRRFAGARWLAYVTGIGLVGLLWLVGWLGYWLLWDVQAQQIAIGTARLADGLPIFADPLSRSFLADATMNSLLFFVVFFVHMLLPLGMGILLWLHIGRVQRSKFFTVRTLTIAALAVLAALSLAAPAALPDPARMAVVPDRFAMDGWFALPLALTDRLGSGALWAVTLGGAVALIAVPWAFARGRTVVAKVNDSRCNGCTLCSVDCPYDAIVMVDRTDGKKGKLAKIDPAKCVGCGICAGSCDSGAIGLDWFPVIEQRKKVDAWVDAGQGTHVAFVCSAWAGRAVAPREDGTTDALPGYRVLEVPCAGWVHALSVERAVRHGAEGVLVVTCAQCRFREGATWVRQRLAGERAPALRPEKVDPDRVEVIAFDAGRTDVLAARAAAFRARTGGREPDRASPVRVRRPAVGWMAGMVVASVIGMTIWRVSHLPYAVPASDDPELVVSFSHPGQTGERCHAPTEEELAGLPVHMRGQQICERGRAPVRVRVRVDGDVVIDQTIAPGGLWGDGASVALERARVPAGPHRVAVAIADGEDGTWRYEDEATVDFAARERRVVVFDRNSGFRWYPEGVSP